MTYFEIRRANLAALPTESGWYWIEDDEIVHGDPWQLAYLNLRGDQHSDGKPLMCLYDDFRHKHVGPPKRYEFFWDGEEWLCPDEPFAVTAPVRFVQVNPPAMANDALFGIRCTQCGKWSWWHIPGASCPYCEIERLTRERDEARWAVRYLLENITQLQTRADLWGLRKKLTWLTETD